MIQPESLTALPPDPNRAQPVRRELRARVKIQVRLVRMGLLLRIMIWSRGGSNRKPPFGKAEGRERVRQVDRPKVLPP